MTLGCAESVSPAVAPSAVPVAAPAIYASEEVKAAGFDDLCQLYSVGCPSLQAPENGPEILLTGPLAAAPAVGRLRTGPVVTAQRMVKNLTSAPRAPAAPSAQPVSGERSELYDVEISARIEVDDVSAAARSARAICRELDARIVGDVVEDEPTQEGVSLSVRAPAARATELVDRLSALGKVLSQTTKAEDVSRKLFDAEVLLANLQATLERYQALLTQAKSVAEMTSLEGELARVRTAVDRVKGDLNWLHDRVDRATLYVTLTPHHSHRLDDEAKLHPGLRAPLLVDLPARSGAPAADAYAGGGLSILVARPLNADVDLLTSLAAPRRQGIDLLVVSVGSELYSNYLGGGERRYLNPYFGFRAGYANRAGDGQLVAGGSLGVELVKTSSLMAELALRGFALIGDSRGTRIGLEPSLGASVAY